MTTLALAQVATHLGETDKNLAVAREAVTAADALGADLVVFPELHLTGYSLGQVEGDLAMRASDERLLKLSQGVGAGVVVGFPERGKVHTYDTCAQYTGGRLVHTQRKLYLPTYTLFEERKHFTPGPQLRAYQAAPDARAAILICNDAWQPHLAFLAVQDGAEILVMPTASARSRTPEAYQADDYWLEITRFYARMYQVFVVFVNLVGAEGDLEFWGRSHVVDPWGTVIAEAGDDEELLVVDLDVTAVYRRRHEIPLVKEARLGLVQREVARLIDEGGDL